MWFWVYCESLLAELECHVLWRDGNRLDACSSLLSWINKGKIQLWTASLSDWDCHGDLIGAVTLFLLYIESIYAHTSISALSSDQMSHNSIRVCQKAMHKREWGEGGKFQFWRGQVQRSLFIWKGSTEGCWHKFGNS